MAWLKVHRGRAPPPKPYNHRGRAPKPITHRSKVLNAQGQCPQASQCTGAKPPKQCTGVEAPNLTMHKGITRSNAQGQSPPYPTMHRGRAPQTPKCIGVKCPNAQAQCPTSPTMHRGRAPQIPQYIGKSPPPCPRRTQFLTSLTVLL